MTSQTAIFPLIRKEPITLQAIGTVSCLRADAIDDFWGNVVSTIQLDPQLFDADALKGLDQFSHVEIVYHFHRADPKKVITKAEHPRENPAWPKVGIFAQRKKNRPNRLGISVCKILAVEGLTVTVQALDAMDGTPVVDLKPCMREFVPAREVLRQPEWATELMKDYFATTSNV